MESARRTKLDLQVDGLLSMDEKTTINFGSIFNRTTQVAIKTIKCESTSEATLALKEGRYQMTLEHPNICKLYDCFLEETSDGLCTVLVMAKMETDLKHVIDARAINGEYWTEAELVILLKTIVSALSYAEDQGIVHRDIKPENIFVSQDCWKIGDFGLSSQSGDVQDNDMTSTLPGTLPYCSPELRRAHKQLVLEGRRSVSIDYIKSDVYSLGLVCMMMTLLRLPQEMTDMKQVQTAIDRYGNLIAQKYPNLSGIVRKMLAIDPQERPTFAEIYETMDRIPVLADPLPATPCSECQLPIEDLSWQSQVPIHLQSYSHIFPTICGPECLESYHRKQSGVQSCVGCLTQFRANSKDAVRLECGDVVHSMDCLFAILRKLTKNFSENAPYYCPQCHTLLNRANTEKLFDSEEFNKMKQSVYANSCHFCHTDVDLRSFQKCKHIVCREHQITVLWSTKCPFCSYWNKIVRLGSNSPSDATKNP